VNRQLPSRCITVDGTNAGAFDTTDWALTLTVAVLWGSSFLWIAIGLDTLDPGVVAFVRVALGAVGLWALPSARRPVPRSVWPRIVVVAIAGNAGPALLFALAQRSVDSSVAAMVNSATPIAVVLVGIVLTRRSPGSRQLTGIAIGLVGVAAIATPSMADANAESAGIALLVLAVIGYGISNNVIVQPQQVFGAVPIVARALAVATVILAPVGIAGRLESDFTPGAVAAVVVLGIGGTGIARSLNATLAGRTGAARGSITTYLVPVIAIVLGTTIRSETIRPIQSAGLLIVLGAALLATRSTDPVQSKLR
jgi:drug/metabolite transporter (DMT)-like permease